MGGGASRRKTKSKPTRLPLRAHTEEIEDPTEEENPAFILAKEKLEKVLLTPKGSAALELEAENHGGDLTVAKRAMIALLRTKYPKPERVVKPADPVPEGMQSTYTERASMYDIKLDKMLVKSMPISDRTLSTSNFKILYDQCPDPTQGHTLLMACEKLVKTFAEQNQIPEKDWKAFYQTKLYEPAFSRSKELQTDMGAIAEYLWTSAARMNKTEFCGILNSAIRGDEPSDMIHAIVICRAINLRRMTARDVCSSKNFKFPKNGECWRGSGFKDCFRNFFVVGKKFRVPGFLATSLDSFIAKRFMKRSMSVKGFSAVLWKIEVDPRGAEDPLYRCAHVSYVSNTMIKGEDEFLFAPYSAFTIHAVKWVDDPRSTAVKRRLSFGSLLYHKITLRAVLDNRSMPDTLPLSPWY